MEVSPAKKFAITAILAFIVIGTGIAYGSFANGSISGEVHEIESDSPLEFFVEDVKNRARVAFEGSTLQLENQLKEDINKALMDLPRL